MLNKVKTPLELMDGFLQTLNPQKKVKIPSIAVKVEISLSQINSTFISINESGYSPWIRSIKGLDTSETYGNEKFWETDYSFQITCDNPKNEHKPNVTKTITPSVIARGLQKMAKHSDYQFGQLMSEDGGDAITADVLWQYIVYGDVMFQ